MKVPPARTVAHAKLYTKHTTTDASANKTTLKQTLKGVSNFQPVKIIRRVDYFANIFNLNRCVFLVEKAFSCKERFYQG